MKKSLYVLKQILRQWYKRFDDYVSKINIVKSKYDSCVYIKYHNKIASIYLLQDVDDILVASKDKTEIQIIKDELAKEFEMKDLGFAKRILGMSISRNRNASMQESKAVETTLG